MTQPGGRIRKRVKGLLIKVKEMSILCGVEACPVVYSWSKEDWEWMQTFIFIYICPFVLLVAGVLFLLNDFAFGKVSSVSHLKTFCLNTVDSFNNYSCWLVDSTLIPMIQNYSTGSFLFFLFFYFFNLRFWIFESFFANPSKLKNACMNSNSWSRGPTWRHTLYLYHHPHHLKTSTNVGKLPQLCNPVPTLLARSIVTQFL